jgi:hypothetical protein
MTQYTLDEFGRTTPVTPACGCPTICRVLAAEVDALTEDVTECRRVLRAMLDHVMWGHIPEDLVQDIDAIFDGNVDDEDDV